MVFPSNTASCIQNYIGCDLFWTRYKYLTQTAPFIIKPVDVRFDCSFFHQSGKFDYFKIERFECISKEYMKTVFIRQHIIKQIIVIYNVDILMKSQSNPPML